MDLFEQFSNLAIHWSWWLGPTPRDSEIIGMGCSLDTGIFKSSLGESNMQQSLRPTVRRIPEQNCTALRYTRPRIDGRRLLAQCQLLWPCSSPRDIIPTHWLWGSFLPLDFTLAMKSKWNSRKMRPPNDNTGIGLIRGGKAIGGFRVVWWTQEYPYPFYFWLCTPNTNTLGRFPRN